MGNTTARFQKLQKLEITVKKQQCSLHNVELLGRGWEWWGGWYLVEEGVSSNSANFVAVVYHGKVPLCCSVKLLDLNVSEPADEFSPNLWPDPVAERLPHFVNAIVGFLSGGESEESQL